MADAYTPLAQCLERHKTLEARVEKVERRVSSFDARLWMILLGQVGVIVGLVLHLIARSG